MPAQTSSRTFSRVAVAGPIVQTIFARRFTAHRLGRRRYVDVSTTQPSYPGKTHRRNRNPDHAIDTHGCTTWAGNKAVHRRALTPAPGLLPDKLADATTTHSSTVRPGRDSHPMITSTLYLVGAE